MHTYGNLEYTKDEIDVGGASTSSYIHPYGYRATLDTLWCNGGLVRLLESQCYS